MTLHPANPNKGRIWDYSSKIAGVLGLALATAAGCNTAEAHKPLPKGPCHRIIENGRTKIFCFVDKPKPQKSEIRPVSQEEFQHAKAETSEMTTAEIIALRNYGGHLFNMRRIPGIMKDCPSVMAKGEKGTPTKVYMRFPENMTKNTRIVIFFHGNGGQEFRSKNTKNVVESTIENQKTGDPLILIAPNDGWGNFHAEGHEETSTDNGWGNFFFYKRRSKDPAIMKKGNWRDFNDPDTLANLIAFAEGVVRKEVEDITLTAFSGGNLGIMKILRTLQAAKDRDPKMAKLYNRIKKIAFFESANGASAEYLAKWMTDNPEASLWNYYRRGGPYASGNSFLETTLAAQKIDPRRIHLKHMKHGYEHGLYREYFDEAVTR